MTLKIIKISIVSVILLFGVFMVSSTAFGSPSQFTAGAATTADHTATSTRTYMTPGTATTTVVYDTQQSNGTNQTNNGNTYATDKVTLLTYLTASSTGTVLTMGIEYSQDGISWYADKTETYAAGAIALATNDTYTWTYASTTPGGGAVQSDSVQGAKAITLDVPTRYIRVFYGLTGANGAVHGRFVPVKELSR